MRSNNGVIGISVCCLAIFVLLMISTLALDISHVSLVKTELQNAVDAAALGGAKFIDVDSAEAQKLALTIAARNKADGRFVSRQSGDTKVSVRVVESKQEEPGRITVQATMRIRHVLGPIFGHFTDDVHAIAHAGFTGTADKMDEGRVFPLAISIDALPAQAGLREFSLQQHQLADSVSLNMDAQEVTNAAFTTFDQNAFDYNALRTFLRQSIHPPEPEDNRVPAVRVGDIIHLSDGLAGQLELSSPENMKALEGKIVCFPVFVGYPQQKSDVEVLGFVSGVIESIGFNSGRRVVDTITVKLLKNAQGAHNGRPMETGEDVTDHALRLLSSTTVKLLPATRARKNQTNSATGGP